MEKLLILRQNTKAKGAFIKNQDKSEAITFTHFPNNDLMELFNQIKEGSPNAMETLSARYVHLIINIAGDFKENGLTDLELILKGNAGLLKAAENFDVSRGIDFSAYASWVVRQEIIQAIDEKEFNKPIPLNKIGLLSRNKFWNNEQKEGTSKLLNNF